ncbi:MAG: hypothetical protein F4213_01760 [Boseongicola sp. SB0677_bin_26]|nr:hypothetical protein [Boseongicola sp. SB0665_bin_10]MYG24742.1 hypothetical protein [Boseongicola sp. SB0677_bin_26]
MSEFIDVGGLTPGSVTDLAPVDFAESSISITPRDAVSRVRPLDEYSMRDMPKDKVGFAKIGDFKGLENEAIIVVDLPPPGKNGENRAEHYVAMSRARSVLSLIFWSVNQVDGRSAKGSDERELGQCTFDRCIAS